MGNSRRRHIMKLLDSWFEFENIGKKVVISALKHNISVYKNVFIILILKITSRTIPTLVSLLLCLNTE